MRVSRNVKKKGSGPSMGIKNGKLLRQAALSDKLHEATWGIATHPTKKSTPLGRITPAGQHESALHILYNCNPSTDCKWQLKSQSSLA